MKRNSLLIIAMLALVFWACSISDIRFGEQSSWAAQNFTDDVYKPTGEAAAAGLQNMENNFQCLKSNFSGTTAAPNPVAGMWWLDTANHILHIRNEANSAWLNVYNFATGRVPDADLASGVSILPGTGLSGGGALSTNRTLSIAPGGVGATQLATGAVTPSKLSNYTAGDYVEAWSFTSCNLPFANPPTPNYQELKRFYIPRAGTVRVRWSVMRTGSALVRTQVYVNGVATGDERTTTGSQYDDVSVSAGDIVSIYGYYFYSDEGDGGSIGSACICCGNPMIAATQYGY